MQATESDGLQAAEHEDGCMMAVSGAKNGPKRQNIAYKRVHTWNPAGNLLAKLAADVCGPKMRIQAGLKEVKVKRTDHLCITLFSDESCHTGKH